MKPLRSETFYILVKTADILKAKKKIQTQTDLKLKGEEGPETSTQRMKAGRISQGSVRYEAPVHIVSPRLLFGNRIRGNNITFLMLCHILTLGQSEL